MLRIRQHRKQRLLMNQLGTKTVDHADRARAIRIQQRRRLAHDRQVFVDEKSLVNDVDLLTTDAQAIVAKLELLRRADNCRVSRLLKEVAEKLKLLDGRL